MYNVIYVSPLMKAKDMLEEIETRQLSQTDYEFEQSVEKDQRYAE